MYEGSCQFYQMHQISQTANLSFNATATLNLRGKNYAL